MSSLLIRNATLPDGRSGLDVLCVDGRIANLAPRISASAERTIDAGGMLVAPPFVDAHFHMDSTLTYGMPRVNASGTLLEGIALSDEMWKAPLKVDRAVRIAQQMARGLGALPVGDVAQHGLHANPAVTNARRADHLHVRQAAVEPG